MKKFRLLKDTPTAAAGTICTTLNGQEHIIVDPYGVEYDVAKIDDFDEWFEEVKEFEEWEPEHGEKYKVISNDGSVSLYCREDDDIDKFNFSIGNCYPTDTPNEVIIKEQKLIPQAMHRLKMAAKKAWFEFDGSEGPDWVDLERYKFVIVYEHWRSAFNILRVDSMQDLGQVYFPTKESCQAYIDNNPEDMKLLFGVER